MTESFEPYRPESSYELDYDEEPEGAPQGRVLWGRVVVLGVALLLAFLLGRATGGGDTGVSEARYDAVVEERNELRGDVAALEADLEAAQQPSPEPTTSPAAPEDEAATDPEGETEGGETYVVKPNDTLASIAGEFYGDTSLDDYLAEANGITDPESLAVGTELIIPPKPD